MNWLIVLFMKPWKKWEKLETTIFKIVFTFGRPTYQNTKIHLICCYLTTDKNKNKHPRQTIKGFVLKYCFENKILLFGTMSPLMCLEPHICLSDGSPWDNQAGGRSSVILICLIIFQGQDSGIGSILVSICSRTSKNILARFGCK